MVLPQKRRFIVFTKNNNRTYELNAPNRGPEASGVSVLFIHGRPVTVFLFIHYLTLETVNNDLQPENS